MSNNLLQNEIIGESKTEQVTRVLRGLFCQNGYSRYEMSSFESYDLYLQHKNFLKSSGVITFTDAQGKLKALKPDVTMSIVKNTKATHLQSKLYYVESVFRTSSRGGNMREISQMGVEYIGGEDTYSEVEIVRLAMQSLQAISGDYVLDISHMGFVTGLIDTITQSEEIRGKMLDALCAKNAHTLKEIAESNNFTSEQTQKLMALSTLSGNFEETLKKAKQLAQQNEEMCLAVKALEDLYNALVEIESANNLRLDFSIAGDVDYYNGIILQGYVKGVPSAVLSGGRYDNLMRRFSKPQGAIGFALSLGEIGRLFAKHCEYDVDVALFYNKSTSAVLVAKAVEKLQANNNSVCAVMIKGNQNEAEQTIKARQNMLLREDGQVSVC